MKASDRNQDVTVRGAGMSASQSARGTSAGTHRIADNRPAAVVQQRLRQVANDSYQARQLQTLQCMADGSALQMKAFSPAVLNVAGEDHNESGDRREREAYVTQWVTHGGYWTEQEFQVTANGAQVDADPKILRFLRNLHVLRRLWNTLTTTKQPASYIPEHAQRIWLFTSPIVDLVANEYAGSMGDRYSGGATLSPTQGQTRDLINQGRYAHFDSARQALQRLSNLHPYQKAQKTNVEQLLAQFQTSAREMTENVMGQPDLDFLRSKAMHEAAQARSNSIGVWKIGQSHVADIQRSMLGTPPAYNLMTQGEFNDEYHRLDLHEVPD